MCARSLGADVFEHGHEIEPAGLDEPSDVGDAQIFDRVAARLQRSRELEGGQQMPLLAGHVKRNFCHVPSWARPSRAECQRFTAARAKGSTPARMSSRGGL